MNYVKINSEGNLSLTYDVSVFCNGRVVRHLGTGLDAVLKFSNIVEKEGVSDAKETECLWGNNYIITLTGEALLAFLRNHYPNEVNCGEKIELEEEYVIDCYDMS